MTKKMKRYRYEFKRGHWVYNIYAKTREAADAELEETLEELGHHAVLRAFRRSKFTVTVSKGATSG